MDLDISAINKKKSVHWRLPFCHREVSFITNYSVKYSTEFTSCAPHPAKLRADFFFTLHSKNILNKALISLKLLPHRNSDRNTQTIVQDTN